VECLQCAVNGGFAVLAGSINGCFVVVAVM
jgi:hypothetical protein